MTARILVAGLAGALLTGGVVLAAGLGAYGGSTPGRPLSDHLRATVAVLRGRLAQAHQPRRTGRRGVPRALLAVAAGIAAWAVSGWPVAGLIVAAAVVGLPPLLGRPPTSTVPIARLQALEEWTRRLADVLTIGIGLEQAISASVRTAPAPIAAEVGALAGRLAARWPTEAALRAFANDLDDPTGDLVAAALLLGANRRGPGLAAALDGLAGSVAEEVTMRRKVEADRARPRTTARWVTAITLIVVTLAALNGAYIRPYGTVLGQLVLALLAAAFAAALVWMHALGAGAPDPRFLPPNSATRVGVDGEGRPE